MLKKKRKRRYKKEEKEALKISSETKRGIFIVFLIALFFLSALSIFGLAGRFGQWFLLWEKRILGNGFFLFPFFLLTIIIFFIKNIKARITSFYYLVVIFFILSFYALLSISTPLNKSFSQAYLGKGGGYLGLFLGYPFLYFFSFWGALVLLLAILIISFMMILNVSLDALFGRGIVGLKNFVIFLKKIKERYFLRREQYEENEEGVLPEEADEREEEASLRFSSSVLPSPVPEIKGEQDKLNLPAKRNTKNIDLPLSLLEKNKEKATSGDVEHNKKVIRKTLEDFGIEVEMGGVSIGPSVTQYTLKPADGVKLSKIVNLNNDLSLSLASHPIRIEAPIPGKSLVGVEVPNKAVAKVRLEDIISSAEFKNRKSKVMITLGKDVAGKVWMFDMATHPHLLVAGATGAGKTICINSIIISLLYQNNPEDLKFIMVDPKRVELPVFNNIPYLLTPVITDVKGTIAALRWAVGEMERRFEELSQEGARDIFSYRKRGKRMPAIVIIIDELADLMVASGAEIEALIIRLAQMSRAVGIYLLLATQRPSVNVITGLIKANITSRIAFAVASAIDSRTILDSAGAEKLLGRGDMLFVSAEVSKPKRLQGAFVSESEIRRVVNFIKEQYGEADYDDSVVKQKNKFLDDSSLEEDEELLEAAKKLIVRHKKASTTFLQTFLHVGYSRASRIASILEEQGAIGPLDTSTKTREIYITEDDLEGKREESEVFSDSADDVEEEDGQESE